MEMNENSSYIKTEREYEYPVVQVFKMEPADEFEEIVYQPPVKKAKTDTRKQNFNIRNETSEDVQPPKVKKTRKSISFGEKLEVIERRRQGVTVEQLCEEFPISKSTINKIIQTSNSLLEQFTKNPNMLDNKKLRTPQEPRIEAALKLWVQQHQKESRIELSGSKIKEKAREFAQQFGSLNFKGSDGWLEGFKKRNSSILRSTNNQTEHESFMEIIFLPLLRKFQPRDIFTLGEFAFFFRATPQKTFGLRNNCIDGKFSKERFTIGLGANKSGTEKLPLMVIGKNSPAHIFREAKSLPAKYQSQQNAWMTEEFFEIYILAMDKKFARENRYVLVVVETTSAHSSSLIAKLGNIHLVFQQPNTTSPLRLGIVKNLKHFYRKEVVNREVNALGGSAEPIDELEAMTLLAESWEKVTGAMIRKSFAKAGWVQESEEIMDEDDDDDDLIQNEGPLFKTALRMLKLDVNSYTDYVCLDDHVAISKSLTDEDICKIVAKDDSRGSNFKYISSQLQNNVTVKEESLPQETQEPSGKLTRRTLSASEKLQIIERKRSGNATNAELCEEYRVSKSTMATIIQSAEKLKSYIEANPHMIDCKKFRRTKEPRLDEALREYVKETKNSSELTKMKIKEKAHELAYQLGIHDFKASDGWWVRFKARSGIGSERKTVEDKSYDVNSEDPLGM